MKSGKVKICTGCGVVRSEDNTDVGTNGFFRFKCKKCFTAHSKYYEKTVSGYLVRTYRNMLSRVSGVQKAKAHLYQGKEILSKEEFYKWSLADTMYNELYHLWVVSGYNRKLSPSIDRVDTTKGYTRGNIRWLTHSENSRLGNISKNNKE